MRPMSIEFVQHTQELFRKASIKYPWSFRILPVVGLTALGVFLMEMTSSPFEGGGLVGSGLESTDKRLQDPFREKQFIEDPYNEAELQRAEESKMARMGPEQRKVYEMIKGLEGKTRTEKLNDAFDALGHFIQNDAKDPGARA